MKITKTRVVEQKVIKLFNDSMEQVNKEKRVEAQIIVERVLNVFELISVFDNYNHVEILKKLYFTKTNIFVLGTKKMANELFMDEKTLYKFRKKYCGVISKILELP